MGKGIIEDFVCDRNSELPKFPDLRNVLRGRASTVNNAKTALHQD